MNFGTGGFHAAYGKTGDEARAVFRRYLDAGGNFIDTADFYTAGQSEAILGASSPGQLDSTLAALDFELPAELRADLDQASAVPPASVYRMFTPAYQGWLVSPGAKVGDKPAGYQPAVRNWTHG